jgi:dCMP deaminase
MEWDKYFYTICKAVSSNSKCFSRQIGAILVKDKSIISTGYNGPPRGIPTCDKRYKLDNNLRQMFIEKGIDINNDSLFKGKCPRRILGYGSGEGLQYCVAGHAERNCLINAGRNGISTKYTKMYMTCSIPCSPCLVEIINAGVEEIIVSELNYYDVSAKYLIEQSELTVRKFKLE